MFSRFSTPVVAFLLVVTTGCSTASKDIRAKYVSPAQYASYDCEQIEQELIRISGKVQELTGQLDDNRETDNVTTTAGLLLFWPALFFLGGTKEQEAEYAQLKGEYNALEQVSVQKKCGLLKR
jgi:hypothetical protein